MPLLAVLSVGRSVGSLWPLADLTLAIFLLLELEGHAYVRQFAFVGLVGPEFRERLCDPLSCVPMAAGVPSNSARDLSTPSRLPCGPCLEVNWCYCRSVCRTTKARPESRIDEAQRGSSSLALGIVEGSSRCMFILMLCQCHGW